MTGHGGKGRHAALLATAVVVAAGCATAGTAGGVRSTVGAAATGAGPIPPVAVRTAVPAGGALALGPAEPVADGFDPAIAILPSGDAALSIRSFLGSNATKPSGVTFCGRTEIAALASEGGTASGAEGVLDAVRFAAVAQHGRGWLAAAARIGCDQKRGIERSTDGGRTWTAVLPAAGGAGWANGSWIGLAPDGSEAIAVWEPGAATGAGAAEGTLSWSDDGGRTWRSRPEPGRPIAWAGDGLWTVDGSELRRAVSPAGPDAGVVALPGASAVAGADPAALYGDAALYATDSGISVEPLSGGEPRDVLDGIVERLAVADTYAAALVRLPDGWDAVAASPDGVHWSDPMRIKESGSLPDLRLAAADAAVYAGGSPIWRLDVVRASVATPAPTATPAATPRATVPATALAGWRRDPHPAASASRFAGPSAFSGEAVAAAKGGGFIAIRGSGTKTMTVERSSDGTAWTRIGAIAGRSLAGPISLTWDGTRYVLLGVDGESAKPGYGMPAVWTSPDGRTWTERNASGLEAGTLAAVAHRPGGYVAVGWAMSEDTLWTSSDGVRWSVPSGWTTDRRATSVAVTSAGFVVAGSEHGRAAAWTSDGGAVWSPAVVDAPPDGTDSSIECVAAGPSGLVAIGDRTIGMDASGAAVDYGSVWTSSDGRRWTFLDTPALDGLSATLTSTPDAFVAVGASQSGDVERDFLLETADGRIWSKSAIPLGPNESAGPAMTDGRTTLIDLGDAYLVR